MVKKAMIMAAGVGSRLDPLTKNTPKPLIPIANQPVLELLLKKLKNYGIKDVVANTHYLADKIHEQFKNNDLGINFKYVYEKELSGTAGGVKKCEWFFGPEETFIVMSADGLTDVKLDQIIASHKKSGAIATMGLTEVPMSEVCHFGVVVTDKNNKVTEFQEKPAIEDAKSNLVNTGIYVFESKIFNYIPADTFYDFAKQVFPSLMANNETINTYTIKEYWSDIGTLNQYRLSSDDVLNSVAKPELPYKKSSIGWTAENCQINKESVIKGQVIVGEGSVVEEGAKLYGNCTIGNNCIVKTGAILSDTILWNDVVVENNANLKGCIVANNSKIEGGVGLNEGTIVPDNTCVSSPDQLLEEAAV